ncbi:MAG: SDR family oxidoreductase [Leptospiraceae bacterium]|nr:SDR family oxidoreductase [Leptospiraceae bacterium]MCP5494425.1 SDR family oxidoreductase [Leptospiraceae bacterium]
MNPNPYVKDRTFVVTGAGGGIGQKIVRILLEQSALVVATDLNLESLKNLQNDLRKYSHNLIIAKHDVTDYNSWREVLSVATSQSISIYGLINSAGYLKPVYISDAKPEDIVNHLDINAKGVMYGSSLFAKYLKKRENGHIINIASLAGVSPIPGIGLYSASKFAVRGFTLALAEELRSFNVKVSCVCPDAVDTGMLDLQLDYKEAAITFSGGPPLSPYYVASEVVDLIGKDTLEILLPGWRGILAKMNNFVPDVGKFLINPFQDRGLKAQEKIKKKKTIK